MAENASGFVDFERFADLNADDEARLFEQAMAEAEAATEREKTALRIAKQDASGSLRRDGKLTAMTGDISTTGSYSDYLKAKRDAADAWAKLNARSRDPRLAAVQGAAMTPEQRAAAGGAGAASQAREDGAAGEVKSGYEAAQRAAEVRAAWEKQQAEAAGLRAEEERDFKARFYADTEKKWGEGNQWDPFNPKARAQDNQRNAQILAGGRASGAWTPQTSFQGRQVNAQAWGDPQGAYRPGVQTDRLGRTKNSPYGYEEES